MRVVPASAPAVTFGIAGLVPFIGLAVVIRFGSETWYGHCLTILSFYGAVILAFVGALHWGYAIKRSARGASAWLQYGFSVAPALLGWLSLLTPVWTGLRLQAAGLLVCYAFDRFAGREDPVPQWFLRLRALLTGTGAASLIVASWV
jgi:hypothetical protein